MPPFFSPEARAAAQDARRRRAELIEQQQGKPEVVVIRSPDNPRCFSWQLRMFGGLPIESAIDSYATAELARRAGRAALATRVVGSLNILGGLLPFRDGILMLAEPDGPQKVKVEGRIHSWRGQALDRVEGEQDLWCKLKSARPRRAVTTMMNLPGM